MTEKVIIFDFGSQYTQLIARRVRELQIYCEIHPYNAQVELDKTVKAVILSGSPFSVRDSKALHMDLNRILGKVPVLGICYGAQYMAQQLGGHVEQAEKREYGRALLNQFYVKDALFNGFPESSQVWMSHGDTIMDLPENFEPLAGSNNIEYAAYRSKAGAFDKPVYGIQFHPEVTHSIHGKELLENFLIKICGCSADWTPQHFIDETIAQIKAQVGDEHVLMALSGGVDSTVGATLIQQAIGNNLVCFFVDNGLLRKNEYKEVLKAYEHMGLNVEGLNRQDLFYNRLMGVSDPEKKRKIIGRAFIEVFEEESNRHPEVKWLGQGTIYPDVIESISVHGPSAMIKSHHNVGGLPAKLKLKIVEPLRMLFKDEVRRVGKELNIPKTILGRHPFPGPGLAIRILGEITPEKVALLQEADSIYIENLKRYDLYDEVWQAGTILLPAHSVGVMGDERTYEQAVALRAVKSLDGMTAEWCKLPYEFLEHVSSEIINHVKGINRVVYDISTKPPATIEWE